MAGSAVSNCGTLFSDSVHLWNFFEVLNGVADSLSTFNVSLLPRYSASSQKSLQRRSCAAMARLNSSIRLRRHLRAVRVGNLYPTPLRSFSGFDQTSPISQTTILTQRRVLAASNRYSPAAAEARAPQSSGSPPQRVSRKLIGSFHNADDASDDDKDDDDAAPSSSNNNSGESLDFSKE